MSRDTCRRHGHNKIWKLFSEKSRCWCQCAVNKEHGVSAVVLISRVLPPCMCYPGTAPHLIVVYMFLLLWSEPNYLLLCSSKANPGNCLGPISCTFFYDVMSENIPERFPHFSSGILILIQSLSLPFFSSSPQVFADKELILSGGAINSPQLLMLSGVGNADDLKQLDIPVVQHLPGSFTYKYLIPTNWNGRKGLTEPHHH